MFPTTVSFRIDVHSEIVERSDDPTMKQTIDAIYENGRLRPLEPLHLADRERVSVTVERTRSPPGERLRRSLNSSSMSSRWGRTSTFEPSHPACSPTRTPLQSIWRRFQPRCEPHGDRLQFSQRLLRRRFLDAARFSPANADATCERVSQIASRLLGVG